MEMTDFSLISSFISVHVFSVLSCSSLESELATVRQEKESLTQQLLNTIKHKVALSQELEAWQVGPSAVKQRSFSIGNWAWGGVAGGHALGDQPTGAAEGGGEEEGEAGGEGEDGRTSEEQVAEGEGRGREGILLLFQRQVTKTSSSSFTRPEPVLV